MPFLERYNLKLYYEDVGQGEPIITNHGVTENSHYWSDTGVTQRLAEKYRVISTDMRGHGKTVVSSPPYGFDVGTIANDFSLLADALGIDRFHILTHATGGMAGVRYAMTSSERLISCMLTDTCSSTAFATPERTLKEMMKETAAGGEVRKTMSADEIMVATRANPGPFLFKMDDHPQKENLWKMYEGFIRASDPMVQGTFLQSFYADPNPMKEGLRQIKCPTLILIGEFDLAFLEPSKIMAEEIPDNRHVIMDGIGHMTAMEDPDRTIEEILDFLETVKETGKARRI